MKESNYSNYRLLTFLLKRFIPVLDRLSNSCQIKHMLVTSGILAVGKTETKQTLFYEKYSALHGHNICTLQTSISR